MPFGLTNAPAVFQALVKRCSSGRHKSKRLRLPGRYTHLLGHLGGTHFPCPSCLATPTGETVSLPRPRNVSFIAPLFSSWDLLSPEGNWRWTPPKPTLWVPGPFPTNRKRLQRFLGFANFYRRFIRNFSSIVSPSHSTHFHQDTIPLVNRSRFCIQGPQGSILYSSRSCHAGSRKTISC